MAVMAQSQNSTAFVQLTPIPSLENVFWQTSNIAYSEGWLFVEDQKEEYLIQVYDPETGDKVYEFGRRGSGPGEYQNFTINRGDDPGYLEVSDVGNKKNDIYDVSCIKEKPPVNRIQNCIIKTVSILASRQAFVLTNNMVFNHGPSDRSHLFLSRGEQVIQHLADIPESILEKYTLPTHASMVLSGRLAANSGRTKFAYFADAFDWALFFENKGGHIELFRELEFSFLPEFDVQTFNGGSAVLRPSEKYRATFRYPVAGKEHYFVLYSGKSAADVEREGGLGTTFTNRLYAFDWTGTLSKEFILSEDISIFTINDDESKIFAITFNKDFEATVLSGKLK